MKTDIGYRFRVQQPAKRHSRKRQKRRMYDVIFEVKADGPRVVGGVNATAETLIAVQKMFEKANAEEVRR